MTVTLSCLYDDYEIAKQVVRDLESAGLPSENISIIAKDRSGRIERDGRVDRGGDGAERAEIGAGIGAVLGGTVGLLSGLGLLAIPSAPATRRSWIAMPSTSMSVAPHFAAPAGRNSTRMLPLTAESRTQSWRAKTRGCAGLSPICRWKTKH
jgi:hypothetical protein